MTDFKLSATLVGHDDDVRAVAFPASDSVITASRDATVRLWKIKSSPPPVFDADISSHGSAFVNAVTYVPPSSKFPQGLIVSGGKDTIIEVRQPGKAPEENAEALLLGHTNNVCALDVDPAGNFIVSGGWDGQARIWPIGKWECEAVLEGHQGSVWAVLAYDSKSVITGCVDKLIRIYDKAGKLLRSIRGNEDVIRALCRVPKGHPSGADFASASNDGMIRLWSIDGRQIGKMQGHDTFIYSLESLPSGELVSSGEDRTVKIWKGYQCIQSITHPAISIWAVAVCAETGDIVTGASDRIARVFTRHAKSMADSEALKLFEDAVKGSSIPQQQLPEINKEQLPGPDFLQRKSGTKEGQTQMIKQDDGSITAHQWSMAQGQWITIGTVVDAVGSSGKKVEYLGKDYDYVFDVDIEDGKPPLKLPYNLSQNPYEAATKFIQDNELPMTYLDEVANFITKNTQGATIGAQNDRPAPAGSDPWGSESRYRPGTDTGSQTVAPRAAPKILPQKDYLSILVARYDSMQKKIEELNQKLITSGQKDLALNPTELSVLSSLRKHLESSGATQTSQSVTGGLDLAIKLTTQWPYSDRLPGLDLFRLLAVAPQTATYNHPRGGNVIDILEASVTEKQPPAENNVMMAVRAFANLFESLEGRTLASREFDKIMSITTSSLERSSNRNLLVGATTLYINYAVFYATSPTSQESFDNSLALVDSLVKILNTQTDSEVVYRAMVALGTLIGMADEVKTAAKVMNPVDQAVLKALGKAVDPRVKNVGKEIAVLLKD